MSVVTRHLRFGWWGLLVFLVLGVVLEAAHAFKVGAYLDVDAEARRLLLRLGHAHGALLALLHVAFALTARQVPAAERASRPLTLALVLVPGGFLAGGLFAQGADAGAGVVLVLPGAVSLAYGVARVARAVRDAPIS